MTQNLRTLLNFWIATSTLLGACAYDASFTDCTIRCTTDTGCPVDLTCGPEGLCREADAAETCAAQLHTQPSCTGLLETCGPGANGDCCSTATPIPGGTFYRSYDAAADHLYPSASYPATVSAFRLDTYEVTVGRFRKFVAAGQGTREQPPVENAGAHPLIPSSGWDPHWNTSLMASTATLVTALKCHAAWQTWTDIPGNNETLPMNCVTWYEAQAFCAWDGGYLPTEAEWNFAAAGGDEQRAYPWSSPGDSTNIDCSYANFNEGSCGDGTNRVGSESPQGDGKWGQSDLAGNVWEWTLDVSESAYPTPCSDCAALFSDTSHVFRGGSYLNDAPTVRVGDRVFYAASFRGPNVGIRCARPLP